MAGDDVGSWETGLKYSWDSMTIGRKEVSPLQQGKRDTGRPTTFNQEKGAKGRLEKTENEEEGK